MLLWVFPHRPQAYLRVLFCLGLVGALGVFAWVSAASRPASHALRAKDIGDRWRVFGIPGDLKLENSTAVAVVRRRDGWLVDFWQKSLTLPTTEQLGLTADIDGIWKVYPIFLDPKTGSTHDITADHVRATDDGVEIRGSLSVRDVHYRLTTTYSLDPKAPRLRVHTVVETHARSKRSIWLGDSVRWGNVAYAVEGNPNPGPRFSGTVRWIGRHGAGGDLRLEARDPEKLHVQYRSGLPGFAGAISAFYHRGPLQDGTAEFSRSFIYEKLPKPAVEPAATSRLMVRVRDERGQPLAAKLRIESGPGPLFPSEGGLHGADRFGWTGNGFYERALRPGAYRVLVTAGIERDAAEHRIHLRKGAAEVLDVRLPRVIDTPGWIAADLHLHQAPSVDADISLPARVVSVAAEGVELAVATDHYVVTDLAPIVRELREEGVLRPHVKTLIGSEVSTLGHRFGHFNVFPMQPNMNVDYWDTTPSRLFASARKAAPGGVIQVNHPRWSAKVGYFTYFELDRNTGEAGKPGYDPHYDTIEVYNGVDAPDLASVHAVLHDFMHLLGRGHHYAATGSSDSHKLAFLDPGTPRTMIAHGAGSLDDTDVYAPDAAIIRALKAGRAIVTSGPFINASIAGKGPGERAVGVGKQPHLQVRVRAAPWIDVRELRVLVGPSAKTAHAARIASSRSIVRLDRSFKLDVHEPTFVVVTVRGSRPLPHVSDSRVKPFAFTNPIWIEP